MVKRCGTCCAPAGLVDADASSGQRRTAAITAYRAVRRVARADMMEPPSRVPRTTRGTVIVHRNASRVVGWRMDSLSTLGLTTSAAHRASVLFVRMSRLTRSDLLLPALLGVVG